MTWPPSATVDLSTVKVAITSLTVSVMATLAAVPSITRFSKALPSTLAPLTPTVRVWPSL
ncbi:hypothetical protein D3C85_1124670 [compost metagenome]